MIIDGRDPANSVIVDEAALWEGMIEPGTTVRAGDPVGRFSRHSVAAPEVIAAPLDGVLAVIRAIPPTEPGDSVLRSGSRSTPKALL